MYPYLGLNCVGGVFSVVAFEAIPIAIAVLGRRFIVINRVGIAAPVNLVFAENAFNIFVVVAVSVLVVVTAADRKFFAANIEVSLPVGIKAFPQVLFKLLTFCFA